MKPYSFEIFNKKKYIGMLPGKFVPSTELCEEHILLSNTYNIKPGFIIRTGEREKFYVTDVRIHHSLSHGCRLQVFYETEGAHQRRTAAEIKTTLALVISFISLLISAIAIFKN